MTLSELVPDVRIRETVLTAVKELAPPQRSGIRSVRVAGKEIGDLELNRPLTAEIRERVGRRLERPVSTSDHFLVTKGFAPQTVTLIGDVREMDLDTHRFDLRHIENMEVNDLRCSYLDATDEEAKVWLNQTVRCYRNRRERQDRKGTAT